MLFRRSAATHFAALALFFVRLTPLTMLAGACAGEEGVGPGPVDTMGPPVVAPPGPGDTGSDVSSPTPTSVAPGNSVSPAVNVQPPGSSTTPSVAPEPVPPAPVAPSMPGTGTPDPTTPTGSQTPVDPPAPTTDTDDTTDTTNTSIDTTDTTDGSDTTDATGTDDGTTDTADTSGQTTDEPGSPSPGACIAEWSSLGSGVSSTACVRLTGGEVACADLDNGSPNAFKKLTLNNEVVTGATYAVGRGFHFAHCVSLDGAVYCGNGGALYEPPHVESGAGFLSGGYHSGCAIVGTGGERRVQCFPENGEAEFVDLPASDVLSVSGTYNYACAALANGEVYCWGEGGNSYLADRGATPTTPVRIDFPSPVTIVGASQYSVCGALEGGGLFCDGSSDQSSFPKLDPTTFDASYLSGATVTGIAPGQFGTCFLTDGQVHCSSLSETKLVPGLSNAQHLAGGRKWACAVTSDNALMCWKKGQGGDTYEATAASLEGGEALNLEAAPCE